MGKKVTELVAVSAFVLALIPNVFLIVGYFASPEIVVLSPTEIELRCEPDEDIGVDVYEWVCKDDAYLTVTVSTITVINQSKNDKDVLIREISGHFDMAGHEGDLRWKYFAHYTSVDTTESVASPKTVKAGTSFSEEVRLYPVFLPDTENPISNRLAFDEYLKKVTAELDKPMPVTVTINVSFLSDELPDVVVPCTSALPGILRKSYASRQKKMTSVTLPCREQTQWSS
ncbi:hypothetical protein [Nisaea sediminum]|uniref:hypothetical protein n=1 Tax=Nisaea sediminum TaxID=2775867 RepID=UPI001865F1BE|nr:hypothetical protein [Nisaea sediminum]